MSGFRGLTSVAIMAAFLALPAPANAATPPVLTESFENCTHDETPGYTNVPIALSNPAAVDLWWDEPTTCPGWNLSGSAWLARHTSGPSFPDGEYALWLNEFPAGSANFSMTGLTPNTDYTISFDAATDNDDNASSIHMFVALIGAMPDWSIELAPRQDWTHYEFTFHSDGDIADLTILGGNATDASPIIDNLCVGADGCPVVEDVISDSHPSTLGQTGVDAFTSGFAALAATAAGTVIVRRRGRVRG